MSVVRINAITVPAERADDMVHRSARMRDGSRRRAATASPGTAPSATSRPPDLTDAFKSPRPVTNRAACPEVTISILPFKSPFKNLPETSLIIIPSGEGVTVSLSPATTWEYTSVFAADALPSHEVLPAEGSLTTKDPDMPSDFNLPSYPEKVPLSNFIT